jgi:hypothetical protein
VQAADSAIQHAFVEARLKNVFSNRFHSNDVSAIIVLPATFLLSLPYTKRTDDISESLDSNHGEHLLDTIYLYGRFPIASIIGECDPSILETTTDESFSAFLTHPDNIVRYNASLSYQKIKDIVPSFDPVHERYRILQGRESRLIDAFFAQQKERDEYRY